MALTLPALADTLELPFGMQWGDRPSKILDWAQSEKLDADISLPGNDPKLRIIHVSAASGNLPGHKIAGITTRYRDGRLFEITLHYSGEGLAVPTVKGQFLAIKRQLGRKYGGFQTNRIDRSNDDSVRTTSEAYHAEPSPGILIIGIFTEVFDDLRNQGLAKFSFIYRNRNLERMLSTPAPRPSPTDQPNATR
ncbi:hypothetical protein [Sulfuriroseicoccus oceanibius]|uniref:Uncharacterized protein n=1 Tax=Sulfuriroseicoccus oceanibius TaxID=2707525 RepID=A0A6B3L8A4_9BACT|nr:hypothetical protein [Sulfuriroseicoccus oceanibius]QQL43740.1 hypothetical protein G3M56_007450 [Sulfuriroseicoccus oceanibius]